MPRPQKSIPAAMLSPVAWRLGAHAAAVGGLLVLGACARSAQESSPRRLHTTWSPRVVSEGQSVPRGGGVYKLGSAYQIKGQWYQPREEPAYDRHGIASWYGADFHGRKTANGEVYDMNALTAAHPTLPLPSYVHVTNIDTGRTLLVRVNDRGPYANDRIIDMSRHSARLLGFEGRGTARVRVTYAGPAPLDGNEMRERRHLAAQPWYRTGYAQSGGGFGGGGTPRPLFTTRPEPYRKPWGLGVGDVFGLAQ